MKPILLNSVDDYPKSGLGRITTASHQQVHEVYNGDYTFSFDVLVIDKLFKKIKTEMIIATFVSKHDTDFFYIKGTELKSPGIVTVNCNHLTMLTNENYVRGKLSIDGKKIKDILTEMSGMLDLPGQSFTYSTDLDQTVGKTDIVYENNNPGQIMIGESNSLTSVLDARLLRKGMNLKLTNKNTGNYMDLRKGKNIAGVSVSKNIDNLTTSIVPYYKYKVDNSDSAANDWDFTVEKIDTGGIVHIGSHDAQVYGDDGKEKSEQRLTKLTDWKTDRRRTKGDITQYRVGGDMWVDSKDAEFSGSVGGVTSKPVSPTYSNTWTVKKVSNGVATVLKSGADVYTEAGKTSGRRLDSGSSWAVSRIRTLVGITQYKIGTNEWVSDSNVTFRGNIGELLSSTSDTVNNTGWTIRRVNSGGTVHTNYTCEVYNDNDVAIVYSELALGSDWVVTQYRTKGSTREYKVATNQWVEASEVTFHGTLGSIISQPATNTPATYNWTFSKISNGKVTVGSTAGKVYNEQNQLISGSTLAPNSQWITDLQRETGSIKQFRVAPDQWLDGNYISSKTGDINEVSNVQPVTVNGNGWTIKQVSNGKAIVGNTPANIYTDSGALVVGRSYATATQWVVDRVRSKTGSTQYRVGPGQWLDSSQVTFTGNTGTIVSQPPTATTTDKNGWKVVKIKPGGIVKVGNVFANVFDDDNNLINNRRLDPDSDWITTQQRSKNGVYQYKVATNMWVLSSYVTFDGELGAIISGATPEVATTDDTDEEQIQYGPEVSSPLKNTYKMAHRKYVDYSSRADNLYDLMDLSSKYFIENPDIDKPTYSISVDVVNAGQKRTQDAHIGDTARIYDPDYDLATSETIVERYFDPDLMENTSVKAGKIQQTIFRYLDKRIKDEAQKAKEASSLNDSNLNDSQSSINSDLNSINDDALADKDELGNDINVVDKNLNAKLDANDLAAQAQIKQVATDVANGRKQVDDFMNSSGNNVIQWAPSLAEATAMYIQTPYGYWLLNDHGAGFHDKYGHVLDGLTADGRVVADDIKSNKLVSTSITSGTFTGGVMNGTVIKGVKITGSSSIQLTNNGVVSTSIASYGISTPSITVNHLDGVTSISTDTITVNTAATIKYLKIMSGGNISGLGGRIDLQGPVYIDGLRVKTE